LFLFSNSFNAYGADTLSSKPIVIGVPTSLYTPFGKESLKTVRLAVEEINEAGGISIDNT
jgi:ABC-type branched-subunit amino acid transport system substrate-binding protein